LLPFSKPGPSVWLGPIQASWKDTGRQRGLFHEPWLLKRKRVVEGGPSPRLVPQEEARFLKWVSFCVEETSSAFGIPNMSNEG
jgi:hypothetical protein